MAGIVVARNNSRFAPGAPQIGVKPPALFFDIYGGGSYDPSPSRRSGGNYPRTRTETRQERRNDQPRRDRDSFSSRRDGQDRSPYRSNNWGNQRNYWDEPGRSFEQEEEQPAQKPEPRERRKEGRYVLKEQKHPDFNIHLEVDAQGNETLSISLKEGGELSMLRDVMGASSTFGVERRIALEEGHMLMAAVPGGRGEGKAIFVVTEKFNEAAGASYSLYKIEANGKKMENIGYSSGRIPAHWLDRSLQPSSERKITEFQLPGDRLRR
ncbi:MAG: hypothetical protein WC759_03830 [Candidatus Micrarchaeia archaeon]